VTDSIHAIIFDLDGTLVDTSSEISAALDAAFTELGVVQLTHAQVEALIGRGVRSLVERALVQAGARGMDLDAAVLRFEEHYARNLGTRAELFPGVIEGLRLLREAGLPMSVVTNKPRFFTERLLAKLGVDALFAGVIAGDDGILRKPHGDMLEAACVAMYTPPASALMIGDSDNDVLAARAAGCPVWCVPYGYNEGRSVATLKCDRLVETVEEAAKLLITPA
jgi:phosphoglycolate phosphatase